MTHDARWRVILKELKEHWRTPVYFAKRFGISEAAATARIRSLRTPEFGRHQVEKKSLGRGKFSYRVVEDRPLFAETEAAEFPRRRKCERCCGRGYVTKRETKR